MTVVCSLFAFFVLAAAFIFIVDMRSQKKNNEWEKTSNAVRSRQIELAKISGYIPPQGDLGKKEEWDEISSVFANHEARLQIAATDMFVERAQKALESRKYVMYLASGVSFFVFLAAIVAFSYYMDLPEYALQVLFEKDSKISSKSIMRINGISAWAAIYLIVRSGTILGSYLFLLYLMISLARAFLHEATIIENRIHSIRLGRLFIYLKFSHMKDSYADVRRAAEAVSATDLEKVFGWNIETSTAFKDINAELVNRSAISQFASAFAGVVGNKA